MSRSPYVRTLKAGTSFEEGRRMGLSADAHSIFRHAVDPRRVFCAGCAHSEFIHSDDGSRRCLYSECKCSAWRGPGERDDPITTILPAEVDDGGVDIAEGIDAPGKLVVKKDPGGRGDHLNPDLPRGATLTAARSGRTAALTPDPKRLSYGISWLRG